MRTVSVLQIYAVVIAVRITTERYANHVGDKTRVAYIYHALRNRPQRLVFSVAEQGVVTFLRAQIENYGLKLTNNNVGQAKLTTWQKVRH